MTFLATAEISDEEVQQFAEDELGMFRGSCLEHFKSLDGISKQQFLSALREECRLTNEPWPA